jgi:hypothetical protein
MFGMSPPRLPVQRNLGLKVPGRHTRTAKPLSSQNASAVALRAGDPATGEFYDAAVFAQFNEVDLDALNA